MPRRLILLVLGAIAIAAVLSARRRRQPFQGPEGRPVETEGNGRDLAARDSLRKFVEAGERQRGSSPSSE